ncbi:MAG: hypothetical protein Q8O40_13890 [Chloroflexota bacterium]|nr:hypothetical protein [Chloroflexota bacterium]
MTTATVRLSGGQIVGYEGRTQRASDALASILPYLTIVYRFGPDGYYIPFTADDMLVGGRAYYIGTSQECYWTYEKVPINSIALDAGWNMVTYLGPAQGILTAMASISPYLGMVGLVTGALDGSGNWGQVLSDHIMIPGAIYLIQTTQACLWTWVAAGAITSYEFQNPATGAWEATAPSYVVGQTLNLRAYARNDSGASMRARVDAQVTNPAGAVSTITGTVVLQAAGETGYWEFSIPLNLAGTWSATLILLGSWGDMAMVELDRREVLLTPSPPPSVWEQLMPVLGSVMTLAMLGTMVVALRPGKQ